MAPPVSYTKIQFNNVPLFSAEFDPYDRGYLVVGGGGGENKSGVSNILALLDVSSPSEIKNVAQTELSRDEDSPQTLASLPIKDGLMTLAGINSSKSNRQAGNNEHLRTFQIRFPPKEKGDSITEKSADETGGEGSGSIKYAAKESFFRDATSPRSYQSLLRLSPVKSKDSGSKRLGAVATSEAAKNEIVLFNATSAPPDKKAICARIEPVNGAEAIDLDLCNTEDSNFSLAYCTVDKVFMYSLSYDFNTKSSKPKSTDPAAIFSIIRMTRPGPKPSLRCLRWLGPKHILLLLKKSTGGADLIVLALYGKGEQGTVILRRSLPKSLVVAAHVEVCHLDADPATGERQIIIAVAGQHRNGDAEVHVLAADYDPSQADFEKQIKNFFPVIVLHGPEQSWHTSSIMSLSFSNFFSPKQPATSTMSVASTTQYIKLASVAWGGSVVVDTFSLTSVPTRPVETGEASATKRPGSPSVRWVLYSSSFMDYITSWSGYILIALTVVISAILVQSYFNLMYPHSSTSSSSSVISNLQPPGAAIHRGPPLAEHPLAAQARSRAAEERQRASKDTTRPIGADTTAIPDYDQKSAAILSAQSAASAASAAISSASEPAAHRLRDLLNFRHLRSTVGHHDEKSNPVDTSDTSTHDPRLHHHILVSTLDSGSQIITTLHEDASELRRKGAKKFGELEEHERELWKKRLRELGEWEEGLPLTVLEGVLFSTWAGIVRGAVLGQ